METPLSKVDLKDVEKAIYKCYLAEQELARMEACGMECTQEQLRCADLKKYLELVQQNYPLKHPTTIGP